MSKIIETKLAKKQAMLAAAKIYGALKLEIAKRRACDQLGVDGLKTLIKKAVEKTNAQVKLESVRKEAVTRYEKMLADVDVMAGEN